MLPNCEARPAGALAERIRNTVKAHGFVFDTGKIRQTVCLGEVRNRAGYRTHQDLLEAAGRKRYQSKRDGRNRVPR